MQAPVTFAPLAGRLAAAAAEIRPADGAEVSWANFMALFVCFILGWLVELCHALDARAAAEAARAGAAPRDMDTGSVPAPRAARQAPSGEARAPRPALVPEIHASTPRQAAAPFGTAERPAPTAPWLAWSRDPGPIRAVHAPPWRPRRETTAFTPAIKHAHIITI